ncbi:MAG TPA: NAD-dependent epimerase/dehydratase family protein [Candidatus Nitrosotalea sp.]|nr:NAD-dependent epimerase/dehydratase family protein [Candidatus Nitrosotalea sp.]
MRVLVSGGAGFIGIHCVRLLVDAGHEVLVVDDLRHACGEPLPAPAGLIPFELTSGESRGEITRFQPQAAVHLAAQGGVSRSLRDPAGDAQANVVVTAWLLRTCVDVGVEHLVFASSGGAVYGDAQRRPTSERHLARPLSPYGAAKLAGEVYLGMFQRSHGLRSCALRFGNVYGPYQDGTGEAGVVAITSRRLLEGQPPLVRGDGLQTRDFVFVKDVASAVLAAAERRADGVINIASGRATEVREVVGELVQQSGRNIKVEHQPARPGEVRSVQLDVGLAARRLGWSAQTPLDQGLKLTYESFRGRPAAAVMGA